MLARKCVRQRYSPSPQIMRLMENFKSMVNDCIQAGILNDCSTLRRLSKLTYGSLKKYPVPSYYRLCAISKAAGILASRKKSMRRGFQTKDPYMSAPNLVSCYGFLITDDGKLRIPIDNRVYEEIKLSNHTAEQIWADGVKVNSFSLADGSLSLCITKNVEEALPVRGTVGIEGNQKGLVVAGRTAAIQYDLRKAVSIKKTTAEIISSFKRNDDRIRKKITEKYTRRRMDRTSNILHTVTKNVIDSAKSKGEVIVFSEKNGKTKGRNSFMNKWTNAWQFGEVRRQIEYKARWNGLIVLRLRKSQITQEASCPACGERLPRIRDRNGGSLCCMSCGMKLDNSLVRAMESARSGWVRFAQSLPQMVAEGAADEAMVEEGARNAFVLRVDATKLARSDLAGRTEIMQSDRSAADLGRPRPRE